MPSSCKWLEVWKLGYNEWWVVGGIYSRLVETVVAWRTGQSGAPPDTVRCAGHVTRPLGFDRWSFCLLGHRTVRCCTGQSLYTVRCAFWRCSDSSAHCSALNAFCRQSLARSSRCSAGSPDSPVYTRHVQWIIAERKSEAGEFRVALLWSTGHCPVNYSEAPLKILEGAKFGLESPGAPDTVRWCTGHCPVAHQTVRCARPGQPSVIPCSLCWTHFLVFLLAKCEPLAPV